MGHPYNGQERRSHSRVLKNYSLFFYSKDAPAQRSDSTLIKDISKGGVRFSTSYPIKEGANLVFEITVPYIAPKKLVVEGEIISCKDIYIPHVLHEVRAKFISIDRESQQVFEMIEKHNLKGP